MREPDPDEHENFWKGGMLALGIVLVLFFLLYLSYILLG